MKLDGEAVRETLSAMGIIASLLFVGFEINQANMWNRHQALQDFADGWAEFNIPLITDDRMSDVQDRVSHGAVTADLTSSEQGSMHTLYLTANMQWQARYRQLQIGILDPDYIQFPDPNNTWWNSDFHREVWPVNRAQFDEEFAGFWEERFNLVGSAPSR